MNAKPSRTPLFLGGCGCLSVLIGIVMLAGAWWTTQQGFKLPGRKADVAHYVNSPEGRTGNLAEAYVGFEFDYPKSWIVKPKDDTNFVSVERQGDGKTWENLNVGYFKTAGSREGNETIYPQLVEALMSQFAQQYPNMRKVSEGPSSVGEYSGYEGLFTAQVDLGGQTTDIYIRAIMLPTPDQKKGVTLLMLGTSFCPDLTGPEDLGRKGELPVALESFRFTG